MAIVARQRGRGALQLNPIAALLWSALSDWTTEAELGSLLEKLYPEVSSDERSVALTESLDVLSGEELLEYGDP